MPDRSGKIRQSWEANAEAWTAAVRGGDIASRRLATDEAIVDFVTRRRPARVLDVGCGEGWLSHRLTSLDIEVLGIDASAALISRAREGKGEFRVLSYEELVAEPSRAGGEYDVVVCNFALLDETLQPILAALASRLSQRGAVVIQTVHPWTARGTGPYRNGWRTEDFDSFGDAFPASMPWYFRTLDSWIDEIGRAGLRLAEMAEPVHPATGEPLSLILGADREGRAAGA